VVKLEKMQTKSINAEQVIGGDLENIAGRLENEFRAMQGKQLLITGGSIGTGIKTVARRFA